MVTETASSIMQAINPSTLEVLDEIVATPVETIEGTVNLARTAFLSWRDTSLQKRLSYINRFRQVLSASQDEVVALISQDVGKPIIECYLGEISGPLNTCQWLTDNLAQLMSDKHYPVSNPLLLGKKHYIKFEPCGVIGIISPWNYPFSIPVMTILMALAVGNTVVLKPSEKSPLTGLKILELIKKSGFPENVLTLINGGAQQGQALAQQNLSRLIFTGSPNTGAKIMATAAANTTPLNLELGGKDAAIVLADAPVDRTAQAIVWGAFTNAGQACASIERLFLIRSENSTKILERIVELSEKLKVGDPSCDSTEVGPLIDDIQYKHVEGQVKEALNTGAKILCGGSRLPQSQLNSSSAESKKLNGYFYAPTVISEVNPQMNVMTDETFGPVLPVMIVDSIEEAIQLTNNNQYGLTASIWSANTEKAMSIAQKLDTGVVYINDCLYTHASSELPWGGIKKSGFSRSHSQFGLLDLVNIKQYAIDPSPWHRIWWYPYSAKKLKAVKAGLKLMHSPGNEKNILTDKINLLVEFVSNLWQ